MNLYDRLQDDIKSNLKSGNMETVVLLRGIVSKIKDETVNKGKDINDEASLKCIERTVKEIDQSIDSFRKAGRDESVAKLEADRRIVSEYLPKQLSEQETVDIVNTLLKSIEPTKKNMGIIMKQLPKEVNRAMASKILNMILK